MATVYSHAWYLGETIDAKDGVTNGDDTIYGSTSADDIYGLVPRTLGDLGDPELAPLHLAWGMAKATVIRARRRSY